MKSKNESLQKHSRPGSVKNELSNLNDNVEAALNEVSDIMLAQSNPR